MKISYDQINCSRCGGSGHFSYCQMYGTTCFKCGGRGTVTSAAGKRAAAKVDEALTVSAKEIKPGDIIMDHVFTINGMSSKRYKHQVKYIKTEQVLTGGEQKKRETRLEIHTTRGKETVIMTCYPDSNPHRGYRLAFTKDKEEAVLAALTVRGGKIMKGATVEA